MIRYLTSGESHGPALTGILEGMPAGLKLSAEDINVDLSRRQKGYGRGGRMKIEQDKVQILSGVRWGETLGSPICLQIANNDWKNWEEGMSADKQHSGSIPAVTRPRPGHADLSGVLKYGHKDIRSILERSSARETAMRVAIGAVCKRLLCAFDIKIVSYVIRIGSVQAENMPEGLEERFSAAELSEVRCPDKQASDLMKKMIDDANTKGDTLGGIFEVAAIGVPAGLGSHAHWDRRLDARLSQAIMSIQAIKGVELGDGFLMGQRPGSEVMDEIFFTKEANFFRTTNHAGGIEGGITNGMPLLLRAAMKPIPSLKRPLQSVDIITKERFEAAYERSDVCAVPAAAVTAEAMTAIVIARALIEKFGGDNIAEALDNFQRYKQRLDSF
ncbi:MAG: chorismate synthase [Dissulfurispiraceae bacterium]|jgi:chorismate synthase|nr:chorismate synthase [Dissulfurispiraceae bacterium]